MPSYTLVPPTVSDIPRLAAIQQAAFVDDPLTTAALADVSKEDYISWVERHISQAKPPPGLKIDRVCAKDTETGEIAGWAEWAIPLAEGEEWKGDEKQEKVPLAKGTNKAVWGDFFKEIISYEAKIMGDRKHWALFMLVVDPAFQRRGIGRALLSDGIQRAHAQGLPIFLSGSPTGVFLYKHLGFEVKDTPKLTSAEIVATMMVKELPNV